MVISLIHPSRSRAFKSEDTVFNWFLASGIISNPSIELIVSLDADDPHIELYKKSYTSECIVINENKSVVEATNNAAKRSTGDILLYLSDDFVCPEDWLNLIIKEFENENRPLLLKVDDCLQPFHVPVLTIPIMNRALYERLGYFFHPGYKSMFCDCDLFETVKRIGSIKDAKHLKFPHEHVSIGKAKDDETYRNSAKNWDQGKAFFAQRKAMGFPV